jgi:hypothetical protein
MTDEQLKMVKRIADRGVCYGYQCTECPANTKRKGRGLERCSGLWPGSTMKAWFTDYLAKHQKANAKD